jgi:hypothetical protein
VKKMAVTASVPLYTATAVVRYSSSRMYSASSAVGKGIKATHIRNTMFRKSRM